MLKMYMIEYWVRDTFTYSQEYFLNFKTASDRMIELQERGWEPEIETISVNNE